MTVLKGRVESRLLWKATPAIALVLAALLVVVALTIAILYERNYQHQKFNEVGVQGEILASTASAALTFDDRKTAEEYVTALRVNPEVLNAAIYGLDGTLFSGYMRSSEWPLPDRLDGQGSVSGRDRLIVVTPVLEEGTDRQIGSVYLLVLTEPAARRFALFGIVGLLVSVVAIFIAGLGVAQSALTNANAGLDLQAKELAAANANLQLQIEQREQVEAAFRQAQKMEAVGHLTGGVAHDFNNLLQIVLSSLDTLRRRAAKWELDETSKYDFGRLTDAAVAGGERAAALTRQLLAFARRQPLEPKEIDVNKLVWGMSDLLRRTLGEAISIEVVVGGDVWPTFVDGNQLENAIINLAVNARDAMNGAGKLTIESVNAHLDETYVRSHQEMQAGQYVLIAVSDTGSGMTKEVLANAFEPFFTTKDVGHGTGLGLSQVYGFVKQSGGHIKIYSELGVGTTVKLYLPRSAEPDSTPDEHSAADIVPRGSHSETILVVEDEDDVRKFTVEMLRELGYDVIEARDGHIALRLLETRPSVRLLFTDVGLPGGLNGRQLADEAKARLPALRILFTSGYTRNAIVHGGRLDEGVALIGKPFTYMALAAKVRQVLEQPA